MLLQSLFSYFYKLPFEVSRSISSDSAAVLSIVTLFVLFHFTNLIKFLVNIYLNFI